MEKYEISKCVIQGIRGKSVVYYEGLETTSGKKVLIVRNAISFGWKVGQEVHFYSRAEYKKDGRKILTPVPRDVFIRVMKPLWVSELEDYVKIITDDPTIIKKRLKLIVPRMIELSLYLDSFDEVEEVLKQAVARINDDTVAKQVEAEIELGRHISEKMGKGDA